MIGVFDSGIGGLTVVKEIKKIHPDCQIIYFGDTARYPWGNKGSETIKRYAEQITNFFETKKIKEIVIACNTASTFASAYLKHEFPGIIFYDVIDPVIERVKKERKNSKKKIYKIGIIGTRGTINSGIYEKKIKKLGLKIKCFSIPCPLFVNLAEEGWLEHPATKKIVAEYLAPFKKEGVDAIILGCTHYPLLAKAISSYLGKQVKIISSAEEVAKKINNNDSKNNATVDKYYLSDLTTHYEELIKRIMGKKLTLKKTIL